MKLPSIIEGVLFAYRVSKHYSTKYYSFKLLHNREPVLPIDVNYKLSSTKNSDPDKRFDKDIFNVVLGSSDIIREEVNRQTAENKKRALKKQ